MKMIEDDQLNNFKIFFFRIDLKDFKMEDRFDIDLK